MTTEGERPWRNKHHIWCNKFMFKAEGCDMCEKLFADYPYETDEEREGLLAKHFPNVEPIE